MIAQIRAARARLLERRAALRRSLAELDPTCSPLSLLDESPEVLPLGGDERGELLEIDRALERIENGEYGQCARCGGPIGLQRLAALPETSCCTGCSSRQVRAREP